MTLKTIIAAVVTLIASWKPNDSLANDIEDAQLALSIAGPLAPGDHFTGAALKMVNQAAAGLHNLETGQAATVGTKDGYSLVLVKNGGTAAQALGL